MVVSPFIPLVWLAPLNYNLTEDNEGTHWGTCAWGTSWYLAIMKSTLSWGPMFGALLPPHIHRNWHLIGSGVSSAGPLATSLYGRPWEWSVLVHFFGFGCTMLGPHCGDYGVIWGFWFLPVKRGWHGIVASFHSHYQWYSVTDLDAHVHMYTFKHLNAQI